MASKLECPCCDYTLKEEGDDMKKADGEYRVYENLVSCKSQAGQYRKIHCLLCGCFKDVGEFN